MNPFPFHSRKTFLIALFLFGTVVAPYRAARPQPPADPENGKKVFEKLGCFRCHGSAGEGMASTGKETQVAERREQARALQGPPKIAATRLSLAEFVQSIRKPKGQMPPFSAKQVSDNELADAYAYLQSVGLQPKLELPSSANSESGQKLYNSFGCYECHGYQGQGSVQTGGSRLGPPQIPYSGFVGYVRQPSGQMPPYTAKGVSDAQLADIYVFLQTRPQAAPAKNIPLLNQ